MLGMSCAVPASNQFRCPERFLIVVLALKFMVTDFA